MRSHFGPVEFMRSPRLSGPRLIGFGKDSSQLVTKTLNFGIDWNH
jgi:hypothetical protein